MIRNTAIKTILSNTVFLGLSIINKWIPKDDNRILLYSNFDFRDNLRYLYEYIIDKGYNNKYRIIRSYQGKEIGVLPNNVRDVSNFKAIFEFMRAGHVYYAFGKLPIYPSDKQIVIQLWHGSPFKGMDAGVRTARRTKPYYTYYFAASDFFRKAVNIAYSCDDDHIAICGNPRNDVLYENSAKYDIGIDGDKIIIWMPTFRKSKYVGYSDVNQQNSIVPFFTNEELIAFNETLRALSVGLIIKIHPAQDLDLFKNIQLSNIVVLSHDIFVNKGFDLYRLLPQTDALITDYSSVFYDYMLLDKPIAFTMEDFEEYKTKRGFIMDDPEELMAGHKIRNKQDIIDFIRDISEGKDIWKDKRNEINILVNQNRDGMNRKRALEISNIDIE